jgi:tetratricopeptide repeat protein 8
MNVDSLFSAQRLFRIRDYDGCLLQCTQLLEKNPYDQAVWLLKCRALTERSYIDELEWEDDGVEGVLDDHAMASAPRPGTSLMHGSTASGGAGGGASTAAAYRPVTASGRPTTGFARVGTSSGSGGAGGGRAGTSMDAALRSSGRAGTSRAQTAAGRAVRVGTASLASAPGGAFIDSARLDLRKYAGKPALAKALASYLLHVEHNPRRALDLAAFATEASNYSDWWWKAVLGYAYYALGLMGEAERQFTSALRGAPWHVGLRLHSGRVSVRLDQPSAALRVYGEGRGGVEWGGEQGAGPSGAATASYGDVSLLLAAARLHESMGAGEAAAALRRRALTSDASCVEATACLAASAFYGDQPEVSLRLYRRLLLAYGSSAAPAELWVNLGLATFHAGQYDLAMPCFDRAISGADGDGVVADVWYNLGTVGVGVGDFQMAMQAFTVAVAADPNHGEARTNMGVLEARRGNVEAARAHYAAAQRVGAWMYEPWYNGALLAWRCGDVAGAYAQASKALALFPAHSDSKELVKLTKTALLTGNVDLLV